MHCETGGTRIVDLRWLRTVAVLAAMVAATRFGDAATVQKRYYAHAANHDRHGVIAPWYQGQNGQCDFRVRIAAETLKRYPWVTAPEASSPAPHYVYNGHWRISDEGRITPIPIKDWDNGDWGQRAAYVLSGLVDYYRYSGDPAAIAHMTYQADALLDHCLTPLDHPWPAFPISVPVKGKAYGPCDPRGMIQLDIVAEVGLALLRAHQVTGDRRWFEACRHWGDLLAEKRNRAPGQAPWGRYANPEAAPWKDDKQTGGVAFLLCFFDELIRLGHGGKDGSLAQARDAGRVYLRDVLLPAWTVNDVWGRNYWDWADNVQAENVTEFAARYFMDNPSAFPNWRNDTRNVLSLFLNHTSVDPKSGGEVYSGAWAFPESSGCCGRSLWYGPMELAVVFAQYGVAADSDWGRELARRMQILATYDGHETGVSEDHIDGGFVVNNGWFKIAHPMALKHLLGTIAWQPELFAPCRENHLVRGTAVVDSVIYAKGRVEYSTFDAPANTVETLRLAFAPATVTTERGPLAARDALTENGYHVRPLNGGDHLVSIRHDGARHVIIAGDDPQHVADANDADASGVWEAVPAAGASHVCHGSTAPRAGLRWTFRGNQVRVIGCATPDGGLADVYLDGVKQLVPIDCWNPTARHDQVLYYRNGLPNAEHSLRIEVRGARNPRSQGARVRVSGLQSSSAEGVVDYGEGLGPTDAQRMVFGYTGRDDLRDAAGNLWRPGTEFIVRTGGMTDSVEKAWWTQPIPAAIENTADDDLYRYGIHQREFCVNATVGPGTYFARLKFAATRGLDTCANCVTIALNGRELVRQMDVAATAGGPFRAADLVFNNVAPRNGTIDIRFVGGDPTAGVAGEAFVQAVEIGLGDGGTGADPVTLLGRNLLRNAGFEAEFPALSPPKADGAGMGNWSWTAEPASGSQLCRESQFAAAPPAVGTGREAVRIAGSGHSRLSQTVAVRPNAAYRGSVWTLTRDHGGGFGRHAGDSAGLILEELDKAGRVVVAHPKAASTRAEPYRCVSRQVKTSPRTSHMRFVLDTTIGCAAARGSVTYDQCVLDGPAVPATIKGRVTDEKQRPLPLALISAGNETIRASAEGTYEFAQLSDFADIAIRVEKQGYYPQTKRTVLGPGENRLDFSLVKPSDKNLLANGDFERGFAAARSIEHGVTGERGPWVFEFAPGVACYIYPESIYDWRKPVILRGKEAISHVTDGGGEIRLRQDVTVDPGARLTASCWVRGLDVQGTGKGFGANADDFAGLMVQELDARKKVLTSHERVGIRQSTAEFQRVECAFIARRDTVQVRFLLVSKIGCAWRQGAVVYDDCALEPQ